jgi:hypothetical protein
VDDIASPPPIPNLHAYGVDDDDRHLVPDPWVPDGVEVILLDVHESAADQSADRSRDLRSSETQLTRTIFLPEGLASDPINRVLAEMTPCITFYPSQNSFSGRRCRIGHHRF